MSGPNDAQIDYWNGRAGEKWAALQTGLDRMMAPITAALAARAGALAGQRVLDIGCGTGETCTLWLARGAEVTGVDVSAPMLAVAARRTGGQATLVEADASRWQAAAPFDLLVSRFGVMFFDDPQAAFSHLAAQARPGGRLLFSCWRAQAENSWVTTPLAAVADLLPQAAPLAPHAPGPFALADRERLAGLLATAGWADVAIEPLELPICLTDEGGAAAAARFAMQIGPAGAALAEASRELRAQAAERLTAAFEPHAQGGAVHLGGAVWIVEAHRPAAP